MIQRTADTVIVASRTTLPGERSDILASSYMEGDALREELEESEVVA